MIRKAKYNDTASIQDLICIFSETGKVLFRSLDEIRENISSFWVYEKNDQVVGVFSLKRAGDVWSNCDHWVWTLDIQNRE